MGVTGSKDEAIDEQIAFEEEMAQQKLVEESETNREIAERKNQKALEKRGAGQKTRGVKLRL